MLPCLGRTNAQGCRNLSYRKWSTVRRLVNHQIRQSLESSASRYTHQNYIIGLNQGHLFECGSHHNVGCHIHSTVMPIMHQNTVIDRFNDPYNVYFNSTYNRLLMEGNEDPDTPDKDQQRKLANLGDTIDTLKELVPGILQKLLPKSIVLPDIILRVSPSHFELLNLILPTIKGHVLYYATCKALQLFVASVILNPRVQLHVLSVRTSNFPEQNALYTHTTKIYMRWSTCPEGCMHLREEDQSGENDQNGNGGENNVPATGKAKLGLHRWSGFDPGLVDASVASSLADLTKSLIGLKKDETRLERIVLGVFIFELTADNTQILVHTIEDMTVAERRDEQMEKLRVC